jgi:hypothetical protein
MAGTRIEFTNGDRLQELTPREMQQARGGAALLLPAVQAAREAASSTESLSRLFSYQLDVIVEASTQP